MGAPAAKPFTVEWVPWSPRALLAGLWDRGNGALEALRSALAALRDPARGGVVLCYLGVGIVNAVVWARAACLGLLSPWHEAMISGTAPAPDQYRILTPVLAELLSHLMPHHAAFYSPVWGIRALGLCDAYEGYLLLRAAATALTLIFFHAYLRTWFRREAACAATFCLGALMPLSYLNIVRQSDPVNVLVFVLAFWALARRRDRLLLPLVVLGTANRESALMLVALYAVVRWGALPARQLAWRTAGLFASWAAVYGGLLLGYGWHTYYYAYPIALGQNLNSWVPTLHLVLLFGALWVLALTAHGRWRVPPMLKRAIWLVPAYLALHYVVACVYEVRLFLPLAPIIIPLALWVMFPEAIRGAAAPGPMQDGDSARRRAAWRRDVPA
jgi:hypothetical protein